MNKTLNRGRVFLCCVPPALACIMLLGCADARSQNGSVAARLPRMDPDYSGVMIPPNIAPLNFTILEQGTRYQVVIRSHSGKTIRWAGRNPSVRIPMRSWKRLLMENRGEDLFFDVSVAADGKWVKYDPVKNRIAGEPIDGYVVYRLLEPQYRFWYHMGIYQRNLENFDQTCILKNSVTGGNCMNCHNFCGNDPERMLFHMRMGAAAGTYLLLDGQVAKINLATSFNKPGAYPSWHPDGDQIAFSVNKITQFFHGKGEIRDVLDWASDLIIYHLSTNTVSTHPKIADLGRMETFPAWSADGRSLYFSSAPALAVYTTPDSVVEFDRIRYDLMRIAYDPSSGEWGELETVVRSSETGKSVLMPRPSPDGRFLLFCMAEYGSFPVYRPDADLYLMDLRTGKVSKPEINSERSDTFHSWSRNGRWFVFASKRLDGIRGRLYFCHVDEDGNVSKPLLMPQEDPSFYSTFLKTYNVPELISAPVDVWWQKIVSAAFDQNKMKNVVLDPKVRVDRITGATPQAPKMKQASME
jgi:hypothetical protein